MPELPSLAVEIERLVHEKDHLLGALGTPNPIGPYDVLFPEDARGNSHSEQELMGHIETLHAVVQDLERAAIAVERINNCVGSTTKAAPF